MSLSLTGLELYKVLTPWKAEFGHTLTRDLLYIPAGRKQSSQLIVPFKTTKKEHKISPLSHSCKNCRGWWNQFLSRSYTQRVILEALPSLTFNAFNHSSHSELSLRCRLPQSLWNTPFSCPSRERGSQTNNLCRHKAILATKDNQSLWDAKKPKRLKQKSSL